MSKGNTSSASKSALGARRVARIAMIAALYAALSLVAMLFLGGLAWGPVQFRISEAVTVLALFTSDAIPGLTLGCVIAHVANIALSGTGTLGLLDVCFGSLATLLGALFSWRFRDRPALAVLGPVISNALIVPAYLPLMLPMFLFGLVATGLGEAVVMYVLGLPLYHALKGASLEERLSDEV